MSRTFAAFWCCYPLLAATLATYRCLTYISPFWGTFRKYCLKWQVLLIELQYLSQRIILILVFWDAELWKPPTKLAFVSIMRASTWHEFDTQLRNIEGTNKTHNDSLCACLSVFTISSLPGVKSCSISRGFCVTVPEINNTWAAI